MPAEDISSFIATYGVATMVIVAMFALGATAVGITVRAFLQRWSTQFLDRRLEDHRHALQRDLADHQNRQERQADVFRLEHQRLLRELDAYAPMRHRTYATLGRLLSVADSDAEATWTTPVVAVASVSAKELPLLLSESGIDPKDAAKIIAIWDTDNGQARRHAAASARAHSVKRAWRAVRKLEAYQQRHDLYCSDDVEAAVRKAHVALTTLLINATQTPVNDEHVAVASRAAVRAVREARALIRSEMQRGYSSVRAVEDTPPEPGVATASSEG